jgi:hypothetical protein
VNRSKHRKSPATCFKFAIYSTVSINPGGDNWRGHTWIGVESIAASGIPPHTLVSASVMTAE